MDKPTLFCVGAIAVESTSKLAKSVKWGFCNVLFERSYKRFQSQGHVNMAYRCGKFNVLLLAYLAREKKTAYKK